MLLNCCCLLLLLLLALAALSGQPATAADVLSPDVKHRLLMDRMVALGTKSDNEKTTTLRELQEALRSTNLETNKIRSGTVIGNTTVMDVLLSLSATTRSAGVVENTFWVLVLLAYDRDNARRLFQEHLSVVPVAMRKLEWGAENAAEGVQTSALTVLQDLAVNLENARDMVMKNPMLVPLLVVKMGSNSEQVHVNALGVLNNLAINVDNKREMVTKNPTLVVLLMIRLESNSEQGQIKALGVLQNLAANIDNRREMVTKSPALVPLLVAKVESNSEQVQIKALGALFYLAISVNNAREMVIKNPTLVLVLAAKVESNSEQVQVVALHVLSNLADSVDNAREMVTKNPALVRLLVIKVNSNSEQVQRNALGALQNLANNILIARDMDTTNPTLVPLLVAKVESSSEEVQEKALRVLWSLAANDDNKREMVTKNPTLVPLLVTKVESKSVQLQLRALDVLGNLAINIDNKREMVIKNPTLVPLLVVKLESKSEQVQEKALGVLQTLAVNVVNQREMVAKNPTLVSLLVTKVEFSSEQVQFKALNVLNSLAVNVDNAREMFTQHAKLVPLLATKMSRSTALPATRVVYHFSCSPANRAILRGNHLIVAGLTKGRENKDVNTNLFSLLALANLFGAEGDSKVLKTDLARLQQIFSLIANAMNKGGWILNKPLLAFRYLCVVEHNRQLLWSKYGSEFLSTILTALQRAIDDKDTPATENAVSTLAQFINDAEPLAWMSSNKPRLDRAFAQLASFPEALKTAQVLLLVVASVDPPKVKLAPAGWMASFSIALEFAYTSAPTIVVMLASSIFLMLCAKGANRQAAAEVLPVAAVPMQPVPQNVAEIRQWLSEHQHGEEIAKKLMKQGLTNANALEMLFKKSSGELEAVLELNATQALALETALKEFF